jgi:hypothetical protein
VVALLTDIPADYYPEPRLVRASLRAVAPASRLGEASSPARSARPGRVTYRRRRMAAAGILILLAFLVVIAADAALARIGGGPLTTTGASSGLVNAAARDWVVRPGDTIWSIAESIDPHGDVRPLVDRLSRQVGNAPLYPGEVIELPAGR